MEHGNSRRVILYKVNSKFEDSSVSVMKEQKTILTLRVCNTNVTEINQHRGGEALSLTINHYLLSFTCSCFHTFRIFRSKNIYRNTVNSIVT